MTIQYTILDNCEHKQVYKRKTLGFMSFLFVSQSYIRLGLIAILSAFSCIQTVALNRAHDADYTADDSIKVEQFLAEAFEKKPENAVVFFAKKFINVPYVAKTLDKNVSKEHLVVNLHEMDCTTFVETTVALVRTYYNNKQSFGDYLEQLTALRYEKGDVCYEHRNHYFTGWIASNTLQGAVSERNLEGLTMAKRQRINVEYMSQHPNAYPQIKANAKYMLPKIKEMEQRISGDTCLYLPKTCLNNSKELRGVVADGDIIVITTKKQGLDCSHIGFAIWHADGLHLLNASQIHGRVIDEPMTLYRYMQQHPSQTGIRIIEVKRRK